MTTKMNFFLAVFTLIGLISCETSQVKHSHSSTAEVGMFKVAILYPTGEDKNFDMDYDEEKHMPMVTGLLGENLEFYKIDKGISGRTPNDNTPFATIGYFYIHDVAEYNKAIAQNRELLLTTLKIIRIFSPLFRSVKLNTWGTTP
ncbi:MAG: EthD family reductase [Cyclobacteriaceae bacterium]|nr:EthD family reductase [Cyclobacteriaceae bacterium]